MPLLAWEEAVKVWKVVVMFPVGHGASGALVCKFAVSFGNLWVELDAK